MHRFKLLVLAATLLVTHAAGRAAPQTVGVAPSPVVLSDAVLARLPQDWRAPVVSHIRTTPSEQQRFLTVSEEVLRQTLVRLLARIPAVDGFVKTQLVKDKSPRVRTTIAQVIAADTRWMALPENAALLESVVASDPEPTVSLAALEAMRRWRMRHLNALLNERLATETKSSGSGAARRTSRRPGTVGQPGARHYASGVCPLSSSAVHGGTSRPARARRRLRRFRNGLGCAEGAWSHARRVPRRAPLRPGDYARRQLLQRGHGESRRPAVADAVGTGVRTARNHFLRGAR